MTENGVVLEIIARIDIGDGTQRNECSHHGREIGFIDQRQDLDPSAWMLPPLDGSGEIKACFIWL